jgi:hypothetical protein
MENEEKGPLIASALSTICGFLVLINGLLTGINKGPIILSTSAVSSPEDIMNSTGPSWARVSFGFRGWAEGLGIPLVLIFASIILCCSIMLYMRPIQRKLLCMLIVLLSLVSIPFGGGFIVGSVLGVIGGAIGFEWPTPWRTTFFGKLLRAIRLDPTFYQGLNEDTHSLRHGAYAIILVSVLSGLGGGLYSFAVDNITSAKTLDVPFKTLLLGQPLLDLSVVSPAIASVGVAVLKWIVLSLLLYIIGLFVIGHRGNLEKTASAVAFAYTPIGLQFFIAFVLTSIPLATFTWPFFVILLTNAWMIISLITAIRQMSEISLGKSIGITSLAGAFYLLLDQEFFLKLDVPYSIKFFLQPEPIFLMAITCLVVTAMVFGVFERR